MLRKYLDLHFKNSIQRNMDDNQLNFYRNCINKLVSSGKLTSSQAEIMTECIENKSPDDIVVLRAKSYLCFHQNNIDESLKLLNYALTIYPSNNILYQDIISIHVYCKQYDLASKIIKSILKTDPKNEQVLLSSAYLALDLGYLRRAFKILNYILSINDKNVKAMNMLYDIYSNFYNIDEGVKLLKRIILLDRNNYLYYMKMCICLLGELRTDHSYNLQRGYELMLKIPENNYHVYTVSQSIKTFLRFIDFDNYDKQILNFKETLNLLSSTKTILPLIIIMSRVESIQDRLDLKNVFKKFGQDVKNRASVEVIKEFKKNNSKKIRLGIAATTIYDEHVFHFIRPIIELLDKNKFELYIYYFMPVYEEYHIYKLVKSRADKLVYCNKDLDPNKTRNDILSDELDVLLDTGVPFIIPEVMAEKLAPVQISWLDCPQSNGMHSDYILVDPYVNPGNEWLLEKPLMLQNTWVTVDEKRFKNNYFTEEIPQDKNGYVTFGTMNAGFKITRETFRVWSGIMHKVPNSRFLYVRPDVGAPIFRSNFYRYMEEYGISGDRISFFATRDEHLNQYHNIDISLDVFPHTGGTTTCESLWMGVPVITLIGPCFFERLSYSNLMNVGLEDLCTFSIRDYQKKAVDLAFDINRRRFLKRNLRNKILSSPLGNTKEFVKDLESAISEIVIKS